MISTLNRAALALAWACSATVAFAADNPVASKLAYGPFGGSSITAGQGYQELKLPADRWFVAYQGNRDTSSEVVDAAWTARAAQLCAAIGVNRFVELRYQFEAITASDAKLSAAPDRALEEGWSMRPTAGAPVYVPIYIPQQPQVITPQTAPAKLAAMACVRDVSALLDASRAVSTDDALDKARQLGIDIGR